MMLIPSEANTASKASVNLASRVPDQEAKRADLVIEIHQQIAGGLGGPGRGWMSGHPEEMNLSSAHFHDKQDVEAAQPDGVEGEKSVASSPVA
jgi:hypothetical protein